MTFQSTLTSDGHLKGEWYPGAAFLKIIIPMSLFSWRDFQWFCVSADDGEKGIFGGTKVFDHHINREAERMFQPGFDACTQAAN